MIKDPDTRYVAIDANHEVIAGPYHARYVRTTIVRTGSPSDRKLVIERAHLNDDCIRAFGEAPKDGIHGIAIFTDNDDTKEPIVAHYGRVELLCNGE